jgi:ABC-2 type transport system permease protein
MVGALWPPLENTFIDLSKDLPEAFLAFAGGSGFDTPAGWANAEMMSFIAPGAAIAIATLSAIRSTAGEERAKTLGMTLSAPVGRVTVLVAKLLAMSILATAIGVAVSLGLVLGSIVGDMELCASGIIAAGVHTAAIGLAFGAFAMLIAVSTGSVKIAGMATVVLAVAAFAIATFFPLVDSLANLVRLSPWYYFNGNDPITSGVDWSSIGVLLVAAFALSAIACWVFERRDLRG